MKVTISELRSMIREALEETTMETVGMEEKKDTDAPGQEVLGEDQGERAVREGAWGELEEAWDELEEAAGLHEAVAKKEEKKADSKKEEPAKKRKEAGMNITKAQLMAALNLNSAQEKRDFERAINRGHSVADALAAATATNKKAAKK